jgi:diguanylate cyclase (GGDEF)-like protein
MEATVDALVTLLSPEHVGLYLYDAHSNQLVLAARNSSYSPAIPLGLTIAAGKGPLATALEGTAGVSPLTASHVVAPLVSHKGPVGVLEIQSARHNAFSAPDRAAFDLVAGYAALAIGSALDLRQAAISTHAVSSLLEAAVAGALLVDRDGLVRHSTGSLFSLLGLDPGSSSNGHGLLGRTYNRYFWPRLASKLKHPPVYGPGLATRHAFEGKEFEEDLRLTGNVETVIRRRCIPVRDPQGAYAGRIEIFEDVTAERQAAGRLQASTSIARALTASFDLPQIFAGLTEGLSAAVEYDAAICFMKGAGGTVRVARLNPRSPGTPELSEMPKSVSAVDSCPGAEPAVTSDLHSVDGLCGPAAELRAMGMLQACVLPLSAGDNPCGILAVGLARSIPRYGQATLEALIPLAEFLSLALNNAYLYQQTQRLHLATTQSLVRAMEARDPYARGHAERVSEYAVSIGAKLGLTEAETEQLKLAGLLHDVGKVVVEDRVLAKRGPLDSVERALVMEHSVAGANILRCTEALANLAPLIRSHHEWYGGGGYPDGIRGSDIPRGARILAVADAFDAMTSDRPYRTSLPIEEALERLRAGRDTQFDPLAVEAMLHVIHEARLSSSPLWVDLLQRVQTSRQTGGLPAEEHVAPSDQPGRILPVHGRALNVMYRVSLETGSILQRQQLLQRILSILYDTMGKHKYVILLNEPDSGDLLVEAEIGFDGTLHRYRIPAGMGVTGWVAEQGVPLLVKDVVHDPRYIAGPSEGIRSELAVPLIARGKVIGVLDIESEVANAFTTEDLYLISAVAGQISTAIEVSQQHEKVARAAVMDGLTGLYNHSYFYRRLEEEIARSKRHGRPLVVGLADVDKLKVINDQCGHIAGDAALREIAACMRSKLRRTDIVARYGGDEFGIIMPETDLPDAGLVSQRFRDALRDRRIHADGREVALPTVSLGLAVFPIDGDTPSALVGRADERLYTQKGLSRDVQASSAAGLRITRTA